MKIMGVERAVYLPKKQKKGLGRMVEVGDENHGYWMNGRSV